MCGDFIRCPLLCLGYKLVVVSAHTGSISASRLACLPPRAGGQADRLRAPRLAARACLHLQMRLELAFPSREIAPCVPAAADVLTRSCMRNLCPGADAAGDPSTPGGYAPYFSASTPPDSNAPDGKPFYYTPGETFTFPPPGYSIEIWDDDANNTLNGYIPVKKGSLCPATVTDADMGCFDPGVEFGVNGKMVEDPVHIEVGVYIGSHDWNPGSSRWWFPYKSYREGTARADFSYDRDPYESIKQTYRCSEYNPTLPGLEWHKNTGRTYPGNMDQKLHYPNREGSNCWSQFGAPLASDNMTVTYEHVRDADGNPLTNRTRLTVQFKEDASFLETTIPNPQRIICLTWKGMVGSDEDHIRDAGVETTRCWSIIFNVKPKLSVCGDPEEASTLGPIKQNCSKLSLFQTDFSDGRNGDGTQLSVPVGQDFMSYVYFEDGNRDLTSNCTMCDTVEISVIADPGLPNKARLDSTKGPLDVNSAANAPSREVPVQFMGMQSVASYFQYSRKFSFKPDEGSALKVSSSEDPSSERNGLRYKVCFEATSKTTSFYQGVLEMKSDRVCAYIQVVRPEPELSTVTQMQLGLDNEPLPMIRGLPGPDGNDNLPFVARVRCPYKWKIHTYEKKAETDGIQYETDFIAGYKRDQYVPIAKVDPENPLPKGAVLMPDPNSDHQILSWSPERGMEGHRFNFCLIITDRHVAAGSHRQCTSILVQKCQVCGLPSETLHSISMEYKTDWLQLWGANYNISNPNKLEDYRTLRLGPLYSTSKEEKISAIASRFSMTPATLIEVNPDLKGKATVEAGTKVCLVPVICGTV